MLQSCEKSFGAKLTPGVLTDLEVETARRLYEDKYNLDEWNLNRKSSGLAAGGNYSRADE